MNKVKLFALRMKLRNELHQAPKDFLYVMKEEVEREIDKRKTKK